MQTITINGISYSLVTIPSSPGPAEVEFGMGDLISLQQSPYTLQQQTQQWPGADWWDAKISLPPMSAATAAAWEAFLAELRGPLNVFQLADPRHPAPLGATGSSAPKIDSGTYAATTSTIGTVGWQPNQPRLLAPGDRFQLGYRLHMVVDAPVSSNSQGAATFSIWPSLREQPTAGEALVLKYPKGLFRLAQNRRSFQASPQRLTTLSFSAVEVR